jgi:hypothetical protein
VPTAAATLSRSLGVAAQPAKANKASAVEIADFMRDPLPCRPMAEWCHCHAPGGKQSGRKIGTA